MAHPFIREINVTVGIIILTLLCSCVGNTPETAYLFSRLEPKKAALFISFLDRRNEPYSLEIDGGTISIRVSAKRLNLLKNYLTAPPDSLSLIDLVRNASLSEIDSARIHLHPKSGLARLPLHQEIHTDSTRINDAFGRIFENAFWRMYRTREYDIMVEFEGELKQTAKEEYFGLKILKELTSNRDYLLAEVGTPGAVWRFRWRIGIDVVSFVKESTRITLGRNRMGNKSDAGQMLYIDL